MHLASAVGDVPATGNTSQSHTGLLPIPSNMQAEAAGCSGVRTCVRSKLWRSLHNWATTLVGVRPIRRALA